MASMYCFAAKIAVLFRAGMPQAKVVCDYSGNWLKSKFAPSLDYTLRVKN